MLVLTEMYPPETANTGKFMQGIAQALAEPFDVHVLTAQPLYENRGKRGARLEHDGNITIERLWSSTFSRHSLALRLVNTFTLIGSFAAMGWRRARGADAVLVVTNPPLMPLLAKLLARIAGVPCVVLVHDVYPHALAAAGLTKRGSPLWKVLYALFAFGFRKADRLVVLANDMRLLLIREFGVAEKAISVIPNWGDEADVYPDAIAGAEMRERLGLRDRFVVQVMGNMGRTHGLDVILDAAEQLKGDATVRFLLVGGGKQAQHVIDEVARRGLSNVMMVPPCSAAELRAMLNVADAAVIAFRPGMAGVSVPSRIYNCLAAGQALITLADAAADPSELVRENNCGISLLPGDAMGLAKAIRTLKTDELARRAMGQRSREVFLSRFRYASVRQTWQRYFVDLLSTRQNPDEPETVHSATPAPLSVSGAN